MTPRQSAKPICHACNRPFDPRRPGATLRLGPTCAQRAAQTRASLADNQLSFSMTDDPERLPPRPKIARPRPLRKIPMRDRRRYDLAKLAFDELFREFCLMNVLLTGARAELRERELRARPLGVFPLHDPASPWLGPEHDLTLLLDEVGGVAYHRRVFNGVVTLLRIDPTDAAIARAHIATIVNYVRDLHAPSTLTDVAEQLTLLSTS